MIQRGYSFALPIKKGQHALLSNFIKSNKARFKFSDNDATLICTLTTLPEQVRERQKKPLPAMLMLITSFTGSQRAHIAELVRQNGQLLREILAYCELKKPATIATDDGLRRYLSRNERWDTFYSGQQYLSKAEMLKEQRIFEILQSYLDKQYEKLAGLRATQVQEMLLAEAKRNYDLSELAFKRTLWDVLRAFALPLLLNLLWLVPLFAVSIMFFGWLKVLLVFIGLMLSFYFSLVLMERKLEQPAKQPADEKVRAIYQSQQNDVLNEITLAGPIKPGFLRVWANYVMFRVANSLKAFLTIPTVFNARWIGLNGYKRFVFLSNFSNQTQGYARDFIDSTPRGQRINLIYGNADGYPKTKWLYQKGAIDNPVPFIRNIFYYQQLTEFWYAPLKHLSIDNVRINHQIRLGLTKKMDEKAAGAWLHYFSSYKKYKKYKEPRKAPIYEQEVQTADIQGLIAKGYGSHPQAIYALVQIEDPKAAKQYLQELSKKITSVEDKGAEVVYNVAFTYSGIAKLMPFFDAGNSFQREFREGMNDKVRSVFLGDTGQNDPSNWWWNNQSHQIDMLLILFAKTEVALQSAWQNEKQAFAASGLQLQRLNKGAFLKDNKEHYGFADGISTPTIAGVHSEEIDYTINTGEFVLGYKNEYGNYAVSPKIPFDKEVEKRLKAVCGEKYQQFVEDNTYDLGKNGSYLVYRQMTQNVPEFWKYQVAQAGSAEAAIALASKMVGRTPNGTPLAEGAEKTPGNNSFMYYENDAAGTGCPVGAHIRRANPRDWLITEKNNDWAKEMVRKHQIIRHGRPFGKPLVEDMKTENMIKRSMEEPVDNEARGLHFMAFVSSINRQFEFVQNTWINSPVFGGLQGENDPLIGAKKQVEKLDDNHLPPEQQNNNFTCPAHGVRSKVHEVPQFTTVVGGEYFFMPGLTALRFLASD
ncbi:hypothetical protein GC194_14760 [bacterium]|nr:hypothetical protein [bacterium]